MPLIYKPYQATLANKEGQKLYYPLLVKCASKAWGRLL